MSATNSSAVSPASAASKVSTIAPSSPVAASSRSLAASEVSRNDGSSGRKKLRGCGSKVSAAAGRCGGPRALDRRADHRAVAAMHAVEIADGDHRAGAAGRGPARRRARRRRAASDGGSAMAGQYGVRGSAGQGRLTAVNHVDRADRAKPHAHNRLTGCSTGNLYGSAQRRRPGRSPGPLHSTLARSRGNAAADAAPTEGVMAVDLSMPILVVDDYNTMIRIIRNLLRQLGFEDVDDASDGSAALAKMRDKRYGLVISDWNMEPMTGYELLKQVRADPQPRADAVHHGHRRIEDRERDRGEAGRRQQLHRQAVQRRDAEEQDRSGVRRRLTRRATTPAFASPPSARRRRRRTSR